MDTNIKVGDKIRIEVQVEQIIEDKEGIHFQVRTGSKSWLETMVVTEKDIVAVKV